MPQLPRGTDRRTVVVVTYSIDASARAAQSRAKLEFTRAREAAARAARHEGMSASAAEAMRPLHARMATLYRRTEQRHLASAEVHRLYGLRAANSVRRVGDSDATAFLTALAGLLDTTSVMVTLRSGRAVVAVAASDDIAREAHDLEIVMAEGPASDAASAGARVLVSGSALCDRWPRYGPAVTALGVTSVIAAPLGLAAARFGAMCALGREHEISDSAPAILDGVARALTGILLKGTADDEPGDEGDLSQLGPTFDNDVVNQAIGMVSAQCACSVDDAVDLLIARAFADELPVADIAAQVVAGELRLGDLSAG